MLIAASNKFSFFEILWRAYSGHAKLEKNTSTAKGKVLVVMSRENSLDLKNGKVYKTGYYLNEFAVPYRKLVDAGYEPVIANPKGDLPAMHG